MLTTNLHLRTRKTRGMPWLASAEIAARSWLTHRCFASTAVNRLQERRHRRRPPAASAQGAATAPATATKGSPVVKIVLILVAVLFLFGALGIGAVVYVG